MPKPYLKEVTQIEVYPSGLKSWMKEYGILQVDIARMTGFSKMFISDVLSGKRKARGETAEKIDRAITKLAYAERANVSKEK